MSAGELSLSGGFLFCSIKRNQPNILTAKDAKGAKGTWILESFFLCVLRAVCGEKIWLMLTAEC